MKFKTDMKKLSLIIVAAGMLLLSTSCSRHGKHTVIVENTNGNYLKIEYQGRVIFDESATAIASISPGGYVKYEKNGERFTAVNERGKIIYEMPNGDRTANLSNQEKDFVARAVQEMIKKGHNNDGR
jgi:hypothetical protein